VDTFIHSVEGPTHGSSYDGCFGYHNSWVHCSYIVLHVYFM